MQLALPSKEIINKWYHEPTVLRLMSERKISRKDASQWFTDFMKWLYTCNRWCIEGNGSFMMDGLHLLDDVWHAYILSSRDYAFMSITLFNIDFIHHEPENPFVNAQIDPEIYKQQLIFLLDDWGEEYIARVWRYAIDVSEITTKHNI